MMAVIQLQLNKIITKMQYSQQNNFIYQQKNQNFPQHTSIQPAPNNAGLGKILAKYKNRQQPSQYEQYQQKVQKRQYMQVRKQNSHNNHHLSTVAGLNYSQLYNELRINKVVGEGKAEINGQLPGKEAEVLGSAQDQPDGQTKISRNPFNFQSALQIKNRKYLPGVIVHTPKNTDISFHNKDQEQQASIKKVRLNRFRISEMRDKNEQRSNYHEMSDLSININGLHENTSQYEIEPASVSANTSRTLNNAGKTTGQTARKDEKVSEQVVLGNSRSVGVGNHRIDKKDLEQVHQNDSQTRSPIISTKNTPRYQNNQQQQIEQQVKKVTVVGREDDNYNPEKYEEIRTHTSGKKQKQESGKKMYGYQVLQNVHVGEKGERESKAGQVKDKNMEKSIIKQSKQMNKSKYSDIEIQTQPMARKQQKNIHEPLSIEVSRVASTIKPTKQQHHERDQFDPELDMGEHDHHTDQNTENILDNLRHSTHKQEETPRASTQNVQQQKQLQPEQQLQKQAYISSFSLQEYTKIYTILKSIQNSLKSPVINIHQILKCIKDYLQIIASGNLDNIDQFDLPLHKKKIIKNSLFLERVAMIVLAFCYATHGVKDLLKYVLNMVGYGINNCLILIKVLEETQVGGSSGKKTGNNNNNSNSNSNSGVHDNSAFIKSDRLVMKRNLDTLRNNNNVLLDVIQKLSKGQQLFYENLNQIVKLINKSSLEQTFYNLLQYFAFFLCVAQLDHMIPFLAVAPNPYLSPVATNNKYALVIDVVEIFCFGTKKSKTSVFRPFTQHFLTEMSQYYELIAFTSMFPTQIDKIVDLLDPKGHITSRLYRHHTINNNGHRLKYLDRIGRQMNETVLLDNENEGGAGSFENCIHVPVWKGSKNDTVLAELCPLLAMIALKRLSVPEAVKKVREQFVKNKKEGVKYINFGITLD